MSTAATAHELTLLRQSTRDVLSSACHGSPNDEWPTSWASSWAVLSGQGLWSTIEPPDGSLAAAAVVVEELGRALYPGPACEALAATYVLSRLADADATRAALAAALVPEDEPFVGVAPETALIVATAAGPLCTTPATGVEFVSAPSLDVSRRIVRLRLSGQPMRELSVFDPDPPRYARAVRRVLYCADTLGCVEHVLERTNEYARQRTTFGSPIGKYQAVAHRLVDHAITARQMRVVLDAAVAAIDNRADGVQHRVAAAETFFSGRGAGVISDCIQLTGAIGFTWEFGHHFYLRRVVANASLGGGAGRPHQRLARESAW